MQTIKQPYEFLVRWNQDGKLAGAHIQHRYVIKDGETIVGESVSNAEPLALDGEFPLKDVMNEAQAAALADNMRLRTEMDEMQQRYEAQIAELNVKLSELSSK